jgi:hypothetical protein
MLDCDWSSDVCSSDLVMVQAHAVDSCCQRSSQPPLSLIRSMRFMAFRK